MIIVGEKLNSSIPRIFELMKARNSEELKKIAVAQQEAGANYLDINTAIFREQETEMLEYVLGIVLESTDCGIMLDSPSPAVIEKAIGRITGRDVIINSITLQDRINELLPVVKSHKCGIVGLPIDKDGIPKTSEKRLENSLKLVEILQEAGVPEDKIYIDVLAEALAVENENAKTTIDTIAALRKAQSDIHIICGVSNVSFGLPKRPDINAAFLNTAIYAGLDSGIVDITNEQIQSTIFISEMIAGKDEFCMEYLTYFRSKK
ncbi:5-methyltetrahydrofolate:corrinoid/iron-sulfur protein co-methyltransferase [Ruminiclostridium hungatei]|uniref:5-methyltetrahydrofolate:corrinoid/iron-sulfur protein co-methyltransferase n=1 Tax=Ruminiclostridium hungatei TaxID=48256 RepID=A0A1V4SJG6_RUMHU|nr:dihydropteroate synthase [Ruminiclostridium hungatei]OPX44028.1 5-methyltetrahydrofolate:corrinoid/iron-sulfur protein co-methyltransferase [Ruminiclostridium hungatei]